MGTYWIVLQSGDVGLDRLLHIAGGDQSRGKVYVSIYEVGLQTNGVPVVFEGLLELTSLLVHIAQVAGIKIEWFWLDDVGDGFVDYRGIVFAPTSHDFTAVSGNFTATIKF